MVEHSRMPSSPEVPARRFRRVIVIGAVTLLVAVATAVVLSEPWDRTRDGHGEILAAADEIDLIDHPTEPVAGRAMSGPPVCARSPPAGMELRWTVRKESANRVSRG